MSTTQVPLTAHFICNILPVEILVIIFEEHAKLEWWAPAIDGQVCRLWRQIILNAPRAWAYLDIYDNRPSEVELCSWLRRSGTAPLHIRISFDFTFDKEISTTTLYDILCVHHTRITSLRMKMGKLSFFEGRDFPSMRHLDVQRWPTSLSPTARWGLMPQLRSLRLGVTHLAVTPLDGIFSLKFLALNCINCAFLPRQAPSLMTLMIENVSLEDVITGPIPFPSLTYLSLYNVTGLKPHMDAPHLITYHEGGNTIIESIPMSLNSIKEYGVYHLESIVPDLTTWHPALTNVSTLSIRAYSRVLVDFLKSLAGHPHLLPALRVISVRGIAGILAKDDERLIRENVQLRSKACQVDIALYIEGELPFQIPMFLGRVSHWSIR